jgi:hypothetical protein
MAITIIKKWWMVILTVWICDSWYCYLTVNIAFIDGPSIQQQMDASTTANINPTSSNIQEQSKKNIHNFLESNTTKRKSNPSFLIHLRGELGNHLEYMARGIVLREIAEKEFDMQPNLILKQQTKNGKLFGKKAIPTERDLKRCFPWFRQFDFRQGNSKSIEKLIKIQNRSFHFENDKSLLNLVNGNRTEMAMALQHVTDLSTIDHNENPPVVHAQRMKLPIVDVTRMNVDFRGYTSSIRFAFAMDEAACCKEVPNVDETVFVSRKFTMSNIVCHCGVISIYPSHTSISALSKFCGRDAISSHPARVQ